MIRLIEARGYKCLKYVRQANPYARKKRWKKSCNGTVSPAHPICTKGWPARSASGGVPIRHSSSCAKP